MSNDVVMSFMAEPVKAPEMARPINLRVPETIKSSLLKIAALIAEDEKHNVTVQEVVRRMVESQLDGNDLPEIAKKLTGK